jgi:hypothetical protein
VPADADARIRTIVARALAEPWAGQANWLESPPTSRGSIRYPRWRGRLRLAGEAGSDALFGPTGLIALAADPLLCALLHSVPICGVALERFLTAARHALLDAAARVAASDAETGTAIGFFSALARQCFINEYVFSHTEEEIEGERIANPLIAAGGRDLVPALWAVAVAAYFPLCSLPLAARLLDAKWPDAVAAVLAQQVREPGQERELRAGISRLTRIDDKVSLLVRRQYEENPYPRWVRLAPAGQSRNVVDYLCRKFPRASFDRRDKSGGIDVLVAGCGTGQHSIETARQFTGAKVLAVDLSMSSLGYAMRKTRELGLNKIEYAQADCWWEAWAAASMSSSRWGCSTTLPTPWPGGGSCCPCSAPPGS